MKPIKYLISLGLLSVAYVSFATQLNFNHLAPITNDFEDTAVSVEIDGIEVLNELNYRQASNYFIFADEGEVPGDTLFEVFTPPGSNISAVSTILNLDADTRYTIAAIGDNNNQPLSLLPLVDDNTAPAVGFAKVRIVHAAPFANTLMGTAVSIRTDDGDLVNNLTDIEFGEVSEYFEVPAGIIDLNVSSPDNLSRFIDLAPFTLNSGDVVTLFAIGDTTNQPLGMFATFGNGSSADLALEEPFITLTPGLNGSWFNPDTNGQGFFVEVFAELGTMSVVWFTYDTTFPDASEDAVVGDSNHRWYTAQGNYVGTQADLTLFLSSGGIFDQDNSVTTTPAGTLSISFNDCRTANIEYSIDESGLSGSIPLTRISGSTIDFCESTIIDPAE